MTQQRSHFFLDVDDDVRLTQIFGQTGVLSAKFLDFFFHRVALGFRPTFLWGQSLEDSLGPLSPPVGVVRKNSIEREFIHVTCYLASPYLLGFKAGPSFGDDTAQRNHRMDQCAYNENEKKRTDIAFHCVVVRCIWNARLRPE